MKLTHEEYLKEKLKENKLRLEDAITRGMIERKVIEIEKEFYHKEIESIERQLEEED